MQKIPKFCVGCTKETCLSPRFEPVIGLGTSRVPTGRSIAFSPATRHAIKEKQSRTPVILHCPICKEDLDFRFLIREPGITGAIRCPECKGRVLISSPYRIPIAIISLLVAWAVLANLGVRTLLGFVIGTVLIWPALSLLLTAYSVRIKPPILKEWKDRPPRTRRTFFEWLYDRDAPRDLFDKRRR